MIYTKGSSPIHSALLIFQELYLAKERLVNFNDPKIICEDQGIIEIKDFKFENRIKCDGEGFVINFDYDKLINGGNSIAQLECEHYQKYILKQDGLIAVIQQLRSGESSKKNIIDLRNKKSSFPDEIPCLLYGNFRVVNDKLSYFTHFRANNAYKNTLIDLDLMLAIMEYVCQEVGLQHDVYIQYMDSLHLYKRDSKELPKFSDYIKSFINE